ncbi:GntR family transcriptional regulator [Halocynthiibacter sp. C4]|uniref:GntR family transcriptional regulator n=1 Tax=Halocynthiibacter sp. C4 TaxID=2992758 RepID=UPI00237B3B14|nr:GntR family transcriptional regulator [Halocynthiibacter sp. C4]MDE0590544.1 GntR family transcriptional regulator [Halocynthiibacter sp. C4]
MSNRSEKAETYAPTRRNQMVFDTLCEAIKDGTLPKGLVLTQSSIGRFFGVSRAPAADALERMEKAGLISRFDGRGFMVGNGRDKPIRMEMDQTDLKSPVDKGEVLVNRSWRDTLYPTVEITVAGCVRYGTFSIGSTALAEHYGFSRTTSHEMLSRLERVGLIEQGANGRWRAPALTSKDVSDYYQIRRLLEPVALVEAAKELGPDVVGPAFEFVDRLLQSGVRPKKEDITTLEDDLHGKLVLGCPNRHMSETLYRSQLLLLAPHSVTDRYLRRNEMNRLISDHYRVLLPLSEGRLDEAADMMRAHLVQAERATLEYFEEEPTPPEGLIPPYMKRIS